MTCCYYIYNISLSSDEVKPMKIFSVDAGLSKRLDFTATLERSSSLQRKHLEEQDMRHRQAEGYELSADLRDKQLEVLRVIKLLACFIRFSVDHSDREMRYAHMYSFCACTD